MTAAARPPRPPFVIKGWHVGLSVVAFFAVVIAVDALFLVLAYRSHPGQVAARPYETGLIYNSELERLRAQEQLGWRASAEARPGAVAVHMVDRAGRPLTGLDLTVTLQRPATDRGRAVLHFEERRPGQYVAERPGLSGVWDTRIETAEAAGPVFSAERRLTWP